MEGLIGEKDDSSSLPDGNLIKDPTERPMETAESCGDRRPSMGGKADRKLSATTRIISGTGREGDIYLAVLQASSFARRSNSQTRSKL